MEQVTIIMPCYNSADTVEKAVMSALRQTVPVRVIIVDDCSTDDSFAILQALAAREPNLTALRMEKNGGPSIARNAALKRVETPWVAGLDSDDYLLPDRVEKLLAVSSRTDLDFLSDDVIRIFPGQNPEDGVRVWKDDPVGLIEISLARFVRENTLKYSGLRREMGYLKPLMRTSFLRAHDLLFREDIRGPEDYDFYCRALQAGARWYATDPCGYIAIDMEGSLSKGFSDLTLEKLAMADRKLLAASGTSDEARGALREHLKQIETDLAWIRVIKAKKERKPAAALKAVASSPMIATIVSIRIIKTLLRIPIHQ